jgi:MarR family transcriptional regulator, organic hydroperoxide resistance regulator
MKRSSAHTLHATEAKSGHPALTISREELLTGGTDVAFRGLLHNFFAFAARMETVRSKFGNFIGLSSAQYMILISIARIEDPENRGINQIADHLHLSGAFVTLEVNKLVKAKYVSKQPHLTDRRRVILNVTRQGRSQLEELARFQQPVNDALFSSLSTEQFTQLCTIMRQLVDSSDQALHLANYLDESMRKNLAS